MNQFPARLHVLMAQQATFGVVIRRGPSKTVCTMGWDRRTDKFAIGQWMRGRIYERRSDLSPDGKYLIYFAMNGRWNTSARGAWTAISRTPYLKAVALFPKGDCWNGGGLFTSSKTYWLNDGYGHAVARECPELIRDRSCVLPGGVGCECLGVYYPRLLRDGWRLLGREDRVPTGSIRPTDVDIFEKRFQRGWWLRKLAFASIDHPTGAGCYWDEHQLVHEERATVIPCPKWEWAEIDRSRLVWAEGGALHSGMVNASGLCEARMLTDLNDMKFEPIAAPY